LEHDLPSRSIKHVCADVGSYLQFPLFRVSGSTAPFGGYSERLQSACLNLHQFFGVELLKKRKTWWNR
jgi:hypothetical protein